MSRQHVRDDARVGEDFARTAAFAQVIAKQASEFVLEEAVDGEG
jgi:hypothetical protein